MTKITSYKAKNKGSTSNQIYYHIFIWIKQWSLPIFLLHVLFAFNWISSVNPSNLQNENMSDAFQELLKSTRNNVIKEFQAKTEKIKEKLENKRKKIVMLFKQEFSVPKLMTLSLISPRETFSAQAFSNYYLQNSKQISPYWPAFKQNVKIKYSVFAVQCN